MEQNNRDGRGRLPLFLYFGGRILFWGGAARKGREDGGKDCNQQKHQ
ncbi:MAG: hypothetical protein ACLT3H_15225 [Roseburia sp.]